jgi:hypothetical protein
VAAAALELSPACPRPRLSRVRDQGVRQGDYGTCFDTRAPGCGRSPETNLKTPIAISVPTADTIRERHAQSLLDLADGAIPRLRIATFEARQTALTVGIRGVANYGGYNGNAHLDLSEVHDLSFKIDYLVQ